MSLFRAILLCISWVLKHGLHYIWYIMSAPISNADKAKSNSMCHILHSVLILSSIFLQCYALTCRSEGGPKEEDLKAMYMTCLKKQDGKNSSDAKYQDDKDWKDSRGRFNQRNQWNGDTEGGEDREDRMRNRDDRSRGRDDRMDSRDRRTGNRDDRKNRDNKMSGREDRDERQSPDYMDKHHMSEKNDYFGEEVFPDDSHSFPQNREFDSARGMPRYHGHHSTTQPSRRFKRSKRTQNSGQRSQYNPNSKKQTENEENFRDDDRNSSNSNKDMERKACALHCFMEQLEMTDDDSMPDRYLVTHVLTKDVKNEDLRDFLQESIEECFQMLENEKSDDKCEFSKMLMMCLSEKGKANCDDWKDDLKF